MGEWVRVEKEKRRSESVEREGRACASRFSSEGDQWARVSTEEQALVGGRSGQSLSAWGEEGGGGWVDAQVGEARVVVDPGILARFESRDWVALVRVEVGREDALSAQDVEPRLCDGGKDADERDDDEEGGGDHAGGGS